MAKNTRKKTSDVKLSSSQNLNPDEDDRLKSLEIRLQVARARGKQQEKSPSRGVVLGRAFRLVSELVIGLVAGGVIGWYLDQWLGTSPLMLLIFFVLGVAAGVLNVMRAAKSFEADASQDEYALNDHEHHDSSK